jgi:hypothetical protein
MGDTYITCTVSPCQIITTHVIPLFNLTAAEGAQIGLAIALIWAIAWGARTAIQALHTSDSRFDMES